MRRSLLLGGLLAAFSLAGPARSAPAPDPLAGLDHVPGEILVDFEDHLANPTCLDAARSLGLRDPRMPSRESDADNLVLARVPLGESPRSMAQKIEAALEGVESATPNWIYRAAFLPDDPRWEEQWHMRQIRADDAWDVTRGKGAVVAVLDTGVTFEKDSTQPGVKLLEDLGQTRWVQGWDFVNKRQTAIDDHAHGNHVAGTIAQSTNNGIGVAGVAFEAAIMPVKVLSKFGSGTLQQVADGIRFAADNGADVINMSLGGGPANDVMRGACAYAKQKGVIVICAAGNESSPFVSYPAAYEACVAISAVNSIKEKAFYSNWGEEIALAAPGGDREDHNGDGKSDGVLQQTCVPGNPTQTDYLAFIGTSMATPHAAGVAALVKSMGVTRPDATLAVMQATAEELAVPDSKENYYGAGLIDARAAVDRVALWFSVQKLFLTFLLFLVASRVVPVKKGMSWCPFHVVGALVGSTGFFFLPYLGVTGFPLQGLICKGLPEWDLWFFGAQGHMNPLFYSALLPLALVLLLFSARRPVRALVAGLCLGMAGHMLWYAVNPVADLRYIPDLVAQLGDRAWLVIHGGLSLCGALAMRLGEER